MKRGAVFVVSGPSGAGKHTIIKELVKKDDNLRISVTATTRPKRPGEVDGKDYCFLDKEEFHGRIESGDLVEWASVHGRLYGTLRSELERHLASGKDVLLQVDVQGMRSLKKSGLNVETVFLRTSSIDELERRLRLRGTETPEEIHVRLTNARKEIDAQNEFDHVVVNDTVAEAVAQFEAIIRENRRQRDN